jgi:hypothetical protein
MKQLKFVYILINVLLVPFVMQSQDDTGRDSIEAIFARNAAYFNHTQVFLHVDKSIYLPNEQLWFSAYLLRAAFHDSNYHTLHVFISDRVTNKIVASERFVMKDGMSAGNIFLPDSLKPGNYNLIAYTNTFTEERFPQPFHQQINIRSSTLEPYTINFEQHKIAVRGDSLHMLCRVVGSDNLYAHGAKVQYTILADDKKIANGSSIINQYGELPIALAMPEAASKLEISMEIIKNKTSFTTRMLIPYQRDSISIRWYPEGGDLVEGIKGRVAFEAHLPTGEPASIDGMLLENNAPVMRIRTNAAGLGEMEITPFANRVYAIKTSEKNSLIQPRFPTIKSSGYSMRTTTAVTDDTLTIQLSSTFTQNNTTLLIHDYQQVIQHSPIQFNRQAIKLKIPTAEMPQGLITLTLFDSTGRPCAERTIFNGYSRMAKLILTADSTEYHTRSKVKLKIKATDEEGKPIRASFSLANVLGKRIDTLNYQDIVPYSLLNTYMEQRLIPRSSLYNLGSREQLEMFLLTRCWTRYQQPAPDTLLASVIGHINLEIGGRVISQKKNSKPPIEVAVLKNEKIEFLQTDDAGHFKLPVQTTEQERGTSLQMIVNRKDKENYSIVFDQGSDTLDQKLAMRSYPQAMIVKAALPEEEKAMLLKIKTLTTAVVKSRSKNGWGMAEYQSYTCNDYFCVYNILNCKNHPFGGAKALNGQYYMINGQMTLYKCTGAKEENNAILYKVRGRYYPKDFYVADYEKFNPPEPELQSTLYWSPQLITNEQGEANISFYTNDLPGFFYCITQGFTGKGVISGKTVIKVIK